MVFEITFKDKKTKARIGILKTKSGNIETPFFMPVATKTAVKHISSQDLNEMGAKAIISNAFVLHLKPGEKIIKKFGGIAKFMSYSGIVFTDSGGFQMYSPNLYLGSDDRGVNFRNPFNGDKLYITPEKDMEIQLALNSDVAMCLDSMPLYGESKESIEKAVKKTSSWAAKCKIHHDRLQKKILKEKKQLLFGITQGGIFSKLREISVKEISKIDFDGFALGGLALGEPKKEEYKMIDVAKKILPENKPVYLMGAGNPVELLEAISRGVDIFDSRFPTKNARHGSLFTSKGRISLLNSKNKDDDDPIDRECDCFVCKTYSRAYLRNLVWHKEGTGMRLVSYHNLAFLQNLMKKAKEEMKKGRFSKLLNHYRKFYPD